MEGKFKRLTPTVAFNLSTPSLNTWEDSYHIENIQGFRSSEVAVKLISTDWVGVKI